MYEENKYKGDTQSTTVDIKHKDGTKGVKLNTKWTQKGRLFLYGILKMHGALPISERDENYIQPYGLMSSTAKKMYKKKQV